MVTKEETVEETKVESKLPDYELALIFMPELGEEALEPLLASITQFITAKGGAVAEVQQWGKRKLAYPIKHFIEGNYVLMRFKCEPAYNKELETNLKISEKIIRYLLVKVE